MVGTSDIQKDLSGWPDDVIDQWLLYFANEPDCGWSPPEPLGNHRWKALLGVVRCHGGRTSRGTPKR
jgi:hypothetical protein